MRTKQFQILTDINLVWDFLTDIYFSVRKGYEYLADELVEYAILVFGKNSMNQMREAC